MKPKRCLIKLTDLAGKWQFRDDPYPLRFNNDELAKQRWLDLAHPKPTTNKPNA